MLGQCGFGFIGWVIEGREKYMSDPTPFRHFDFLFMIVIPLPGLFVGDGERCFNFSGDVFILLDPCCNSVAEFFAVFDALGEQRIVEPIG